ncbi:MAG: dephospho-CoA kinase [Alphaproteobacteria bacterium]|nr:dephospho-CoA kinase [Alphaproteobacteria bacterium]
MTNRRKTKKLMVLGLTGSIGMGKSTAANILRGFGLSVYSADAAVHALLKRGGKAVKPVARLFPGTLKKGAIDRDLLGRTVFAAPGKLRRLEQILHPLARAAERSFLAKARKEGARAAVLEIPLLFETKAEKRCGATLCVTATKAVQKRRVMKRPGMTAAKFRAILKQQMPDREKRRRADYVINTAKGQAATRRALARIWKILQESKT